MFSKRFWAVLGLAAGAGGVALAADVVGWRELPGLRVEGSRVLAPGQPDGGRKPSYLATPTRIEVVFSTPAALEAERERTGMNYIAARLFQCDAPDRDALEPAAQKVGYLGDYGRVTALPLADGRARYRAVFDDRLSYRVDGQGRFVPALGSGDLCFGLYGARMWWGRARSEGVRLRLSAPRA